MEKMIMSENGADSMLELVSSGGIVAVLVVDDAADAVPLARALMEGGIHAMELTLRTPAAIDALRAVVTEAPKMTAGIGTILTVEQVGEVKKAGAAFGVSSGTNVRVIGEAREIGLPFAPGIVTPSDIEQALECGCRLLKFFPAEPSGGLKYLKSMATPYAHLGLRYLPLGGLNESNFGDYLRSPLVPAVGGSWIAPRDLIRQGSWDAITENARRASRVVAEIRKEAEQ